ncbi:Mu gp29-like protein [Rhodococcus phage ReqiDocB7]|uniref:portal protein n=1 Tax=Rhodococcus phage ReqiDocB7 TaxID=691966 RepID=UPI0001CDEA8D|nr:portal protein [Rhodococcus phage ReqiDocB7]ADD80790.1 Mu gp29-like protein [Rhodococcus phage ReqiDocB7]
MSGLLGPDGGPASSYYERKTGRPKNPKPLVGEVAGAWGGADATFVNLPGGGALKVDTSRLTLGDFRRMSEHPQIASSLRLMSFMMHQLDWKLEGGTAQTRKHCDENLRMIWTPLIRSMSSSHIFGFSPNATQWENKPGSSRIWLNKIKDLVPEECEVKWKFIDGAPIPSEIPGAEPLKQKVPIFDGIMQRGKHTVPVTNSFWYPLLMQNGDYKGTKLLRAAFQSWYFSNLIKLFANQYYERFGSPLPVGRAPYDEEINVGTAENPKMIPGNKLMGQIMTNLRNRSIVVLPNQRTQDGLGGTRTFDYELEYLESQMRGVEFDRMLQRYDEEMSLALFTPLLLMRTADGGGFNQGVGHQQVWLWMLNALAGDYGEYINRYILAPMARFNFGANVEPPRIKFRKLGVAQQETLRAIAQAMLSKGQIKVDVDELGAHLGMELEEIEVLDQPIEAPEETDDGEPQKDKRTNRDERLKNDDLPNVTNPKSVTKQITQRVAQQATKEFASGKARKDWTPSLGYHRQLTAALEASGEWAAEDLATAYSSQLTALLRDGIGSGCYHSASDFMEDFEKLSDMVLEGLID